jgi:hypothetical protein
MVYGMNGWFDGNPYEIAVFAVIMAIYCWAKFSKPKQKQNEKTDRSSGS